MDPVDPVDPVLYAAWVKYMVISRKVSTMPIRSRRVVFAVMREHYECGSEMFLPSIGMTAADFCAFHVLGAGPPRATEQ